MPELKKENKNVHNKFNEFNQRLLFADKFIKKYAINCYNEIVENEDINVLEFNKFEKIIKIYILEEYLKRIYKEDINMINNKHIEIIINKLSQNKNVIFDMPANKKAVIEYNNFKIEKIKESVKYQYEFIDYIKLPNNKEILIDNESTLTNNYVIHLNSKEIKLPFIVRTRNDGDYMNVKNMQGTKKVNDIFIDSKIPRKLRDIYPIVTDSTGKIIWIPGIKKSHLDRKKEQKYDIILKYN